MLGAGLQQILDSEVAAATPFRIFTLLIFLLAISHTFLANHFTLLAKKVKTSFARKKKRKDDVSFLAEILFFFGEIEIVFALWVIPLVIVVTMFYGWQDVIKYLDTRVYVEPFFMVVMMSLASTRPIIQLAEKGTSAVVRWFGNSAACWWMVVLTVGPLLGSLITEAAALTIAALLLKGKIYMRKPSKKLSYATLGLLFVNFSVGGILTNFAAPPAITLSRCWGWTGSDFFARFAMPVTIGMILVNVLYYFAVRKDFKRLSTPIEGELDSIDADAKKGPVPSWVTFIHVLFISWTIVMAHHPPIFLGSYLLFLGFHQATKPHQYVLNVKKPLLVGLFLAGLVIHGGFQGWWIEPLLGKLGAGEMLLAGSGLTAINENTTVAYLGCLLDEVAPAIRYSLAAGLVAGGGLTVIAHAPNPAGQSLLRPYFRRGISPWNLFLAALVPTLIFIGLFYLFTPA